MFLRMPEISVVQPLDVWYYCMKYMSLATRFHSRNLLTFHYDPF